MKTFLIIAALTTATPALCAENIPAPCKGVENISYRLVEDAFILRPDLVYSPIRLPETTALLQQACAKGYAAAKAGKPSTRQLTATSIPTDVVDAMSVIGDMAMDLAWQAGYTAAAN